MDHLCNISPEGDVVKKKNETDLGKMQADTSQIYRVGIYIRVTRERRDENGRPNSRKRCFEKP